MREVGSDECCDVYDSPGLWRNLGESLSGAGGANQKPNHRCNVGVCFCDHVKICYAHGDNALQMSRSYVMIGERRGSDKSASVRMRTSAWKDKERRSHGGDDDYGKWNGWCVGGRQRVLNYLVAIGLHDR